MSQWVEQSSATTIKMGPFLDETDGKTTEEALAIAQADIRVSKNGGNFAQTNNVAGATHDENGYYGVPLDATDTNTLGTLRVAIHEAGALPVWQDFMIVPTNVWDSMFGADKLQVDLTQMGGVTQSATDLKDFADAGYDPGTNKVQGVVLTDTCTTLTGHTAQTGDNFARIGAAGVSLTDLGGMSAGMKAEVNVEADTALSDIKLDHLLAVADGDDVADNSVIGQMTATDGDWSNFAKATDALQAIRDRGDAAWTTGAGTGLTSLATGTAQAGAANTITLAAGASATDNLYRGARIVTTGGTGAGQSRIATAYTGATRVLTVGPLGWATNPDATTTYEIQGADGHVGMWDGGEVFGLGTDGKILISTDAQDLSGSLDVNTKTVTADAITAAAIATDAVDADALAADALAEINAQVADVMKTDTITQLVQQLPPSTPTFEEALMYLYQYFRNKRTETATEIKMMAEDEATVIAKSTISDDAVTFTKGEFVTGP